MKQMKRRGIVALSLAGLIGLGYFAWSANRAGQAVAAPEPAAKRPKAGRDS